jgi:rod shape-determining protein MreC
VKDFFRRNGFWLLVIAFLLSVLIGISSALMGGNADPLSDLVSAVTAPVRNGVSAVADWAGGVSRYVFHYGEMQELQDLEKKVAELEGELREGQEAIQENARLRELLGLRSKRQDLTFESAKVTARSASNWQSTLTLSKGEEAGLQPGNCVITSTGVLVGVVSKVGSHTATVSTVIDTSMEMGGIITRTNSAGVLEGDFALMKEGRLKLSYLPDGAQLVAGDEVLTSGKGDVYPSGLVVGQVEGVFSDASGMNRYAVVAPEVELDTLVEVFVVKDFDIVE